VKGGSSLLVLSLRVRRKEGKEENWMLEIFSKRPFSLRLRGDRKWEKGKEGKTSKSLWSGRCRNGKRGDDRACAYHILLVLIRMGEEREQGEKEGGGGEEGLSPSHQQVTKEIEVT